MYGSIFRMQVRSGQEQGVVDLFEEWEMRRKAKAMGSIGGLLMKPEAPESSSAWPCSRINPPTGRTPTTRSKANGTKGYGSSWRRTPTGRTASTWQGTSGRRDRAVDVVQRPGSVPAFRGSSIASGR